MRFQIGFKFGREVAHVAVVDDAWGRKIQISDRSEV